MVGTIIKTENGHLIEIRPDINDKYILRAEHWDDQIIEMDVTTKDLKELAREIQHFTNLND